MRYSIRRIGAVAAALIIVCAVIILFFFLRTDDNPGLTLAAAEQEVLGQYEGEIVSGKEHGEGYLIQLQSSQGLYELTVEQAGITGIRALERFGTEEPGAVSPEPGSSDSPSPDASQAPTGEPALTPTSTPEETNQPGATPTPKATNPPASPQATQRPTVTSKPPAVTTNPSILISEQKASELALKKVAGVVQDIDKEEEGGRWYYFVEIETKDGREADVQLNAASGAVVSVTWDDDDDD